MPVPFSAIALYPLFHLSWSAELCFLLPGVCHCNTSCRGTWLLTHSFQDALWELLSGHCSPGGVVGRRGSIWDSGKFQSAHGEAHSQDQMEETPRTRKKVHFRETRVDRLDRRKLFRHYTVGSYDSFDASSDCVIDEKTVVMQKRDNEGFGFVLRGAKANTPIEEFTPTPVFPALQYLESVDEGGVAWQAGLRTGDFLIEVNQGSVVKVGHRQVVNMIRQGGNHLVIKVVTVSRNMDLGDTARKIAPPAPKRAPSTALSRRSKSMTSELEELGKHCIRGKKMTVTGKVHVLHYEHNKVDEVTPSQKPLWDDMSTDMRVAAIKPRPSSRCLATPKEMNVQFAVEQVDLMKWPSLYERQGIAVVSPTVPGTPAGGSHLGVSKGTMRRQKSIGVTEEERQFLTPPLLKFSRSLSVPDTYQDIPPPPAISPPAPPYNSPKPPVVGGDSGTIRPGFTPNSAAKDTGSLTRGDSNMGTMRRHKGMYCRQSSEHFDSVNPYKTNVLSLQNVHNHRSSVLENPYSKTGKPGVKALYVPAKPARRKGMLVKQLNVEDSPEKTCSIPIPTIIIKEPSISSSGKSSQGSSMEIDTSASDHPGQLRPDGSHRKICNRQKRLEAHRCSSAFISTDLGDEDVGLVPVPAPRLRQSKSIDEGMFRNDEHLHKLMDPPSSLLVIPQGERGGSGNVTDFTSHESTLVRVPLSTCTGNSPHLDSPLSLPVTVGKTYSSSNGGTYVHPVTGKVLDPSSPLALALAARDRAMKEQQVYQPPPPQQSKTDPPKPDLNKPLFIDTKLRPNTVTATGRPGRGGLRRQMTGAKYETNLAKDESEKVERTNMLIDIVDTSQHKSAGLLMVHMVGRTTPDVNSPSVGERENTITEGPDSTPSELRDSNQPVIPAGKPQTPNTHDPAATTSHSKAFISVSSVDDSFQKLPFHIPPPPLASVDITEEFVFSEPLPPPLEFANSFDIPEDQAGVIVKLVKQHNTGMGASSLAPYHHPHQGVGTADVRKSPASLTSCVPPESLEPVNDSGIEEADSRSSGDPRLETTSTVSTVSSISTLSSEGGEPLDTCTIYADGQAFVTDRPPVPPKPKMKPIINKSNTIYKDALIEEDLDTFGMPLPPAPALPPPSGGSTPPLDPPKTPTQRTSKLWGNPPELTSPPLPNPKTNMMSEHNSVLQQMNRDRTAKPGETLDSPTGSRANSGARALEVSVSGTQRNTTVTFPTQPGAHQANSEPHPLTSPPDSSPTPSHASSLSHSPSPTLTEVFSLPTPPLCSGPCSLGSGGSRSSSPLTLAQAVSDKPFASKPVPLWTKQDVADWLENLNLAEHRDAFMYNDIEGAHLPNLQKEDLIDLGVTRVGHRMNIERALKLLMDR
ncbi:SH3 and multiple ankyrin repeat domains protein 2-like [Anguilla rostrata]|uniref:SH3 and multiple ankyrin repeat domains protein 2-like n=1 Tax=Anguilla rostrata TaxID=7938 RepID=UPI0030CB8B2B